ncbi:MAG: helix-turn-helix domain-containing protein [Bacillota bacterium]|nr:helix-turn-helix domain-containing protein [Bacillota bacterium]
MPEKRKETKNVLHALGIGTILRDIRNNYELTLDEVSSATGIASETIRRIEVNKYEPKLSTLETLSDYYRVDLIELIARKRRNNSIFSEELVMTINEYLNNHDFDGIKAFANSMINISEIDNLSSDLNLKSLLYTLKYIKYDPNNGQNDTIAVLEDILLKLSQTHPTMNQNSYPFPIETSIRLLLSVVYRQNGNYNKAIDLLNNLIDKIQKMPLINDRFSDYLASSYINLAYVHHSNNNHKMVIETVNKSFSNAKVNYTPIALSHLLYRKGLSMLILEEIGYESFINVSYSLMDIETKKMIENNLLKNYSYVLKNRCP